MELRFPLLLALGLVSILLWSLEYFGIGKVYQLRVGGVRSRTSVDIKRLLNYLLGLVGLLLISYSLAQPRVPSKVVPDSIEVNDIFLVLDVSKSMLAIDLEPNRLEVAKEKMRQFAALRPKDRLGIIIFSEKVFTLLPLSTDPALVDKILSEINTDSLGSGTNIGDSIALAVARSELSQTKNQVIVLLTDGVDNVGNMPPMKAAELAKKKNIKIYTIALGTDGDAKMPIGRGLLGQRYQLIPGGSIDTKTLQKISDLTGGQMFRANSEEALAEILAQINQLERTEIKAKGRTVYEEHYWSFLAWGLLIFAGHLILRFKLFNEVV